MAYIVFARKYRPQQFKDLIGQEHITQILTQAVVQSRTHHGYLFCGPRGVGKTSCARIFAKALNCEKGPTVEPCGTCSACKEISNGTSFDVLEIDGASNRGIDEIRVLRDNIKFAPNYGKFKVYIVDEVHMLTSEAFNALLKTLEEPPPHVKFIFATTEPQKVPATIISRCQRFDFKRVGIQPISAHLKVIAAAENVSIDDDALYAVAKAASGSLRDALSILDQLSSLSEKGIHHAEVFGMLGIVETQMLFDLADTIVGNDCAAALETLEKIISQGKDIKQLLKDLVEHFRHLMVIKVGGQSLSKLIDYPATFKEMLWEQSKNITLQRILHAIDAFIEAQENARITESIRTPLEVALAKLTFEDNEAQPAKPITITPQPAPKSVSPVSKPVVTASDSPVKASASNPSSVGGASVVKAESLKSAATAPLIQPISAGSFDVSLLLKEWDKLTHAVSKHKMSTASYLQEGAPVGVEGDVVVIGFKKALTFQKESLETKANLDLVNSVFSQILGKPVRVRYDFVENYQIKKQDKTVSSAIDDFGGTVINQWHNEN